MKFIKQILPRSLLGRSLLILMTPIILIQLITTYIFFDRHWDKVTDRLSYAVAGEIAYIVHDIGDDFSQENIERVSQNAVKFFNFLVSYEPQGSLAALPDSRETMVGKALYAELSREFIQDMRISMDVEEKWIEVALVAEEGILSIAMPQRRLFSSSGYIFLLWMIAISITLLVIAILFMRNQIRPIRRLAVVAERFGRGQSVPDTYKPEGAREVRQAGRAFLDMHDRLRRQIEQRTAMLAGISHDLRTPLTRMKLQTEMLGDTTDAHELKNDISEMERMVNAYLDFVRGQGDEKMQKVSLRDVLQKIELNIHRTGKSVLFNMFDDVHLTVRPLAFQRCLVNLIQNATKYGENVEVGVLQDDVFVTILIDDDGVGIPQDQREDVLKPFFRVESSRNLDTGGIGLGLPIAQDIILSHGGKLELETSPKGGLRVAVTLSK